MVNSEIAKNPTFPRGHTYSYNRVWGFDDSEWGCCQSGSYEDPGCVFLCCNHRTLRGHLEICFMLKT